jgi:hypothetical protein
MAHPGPIDEDLLLRRIRHVAADLQRQTEGLFRAPYGLLHRITPEESKDRIAVDFLLSTHGTWDDTMPYATVVYGLENSLMGKILTATCEGVGSLMGHMVGSFLFLLQYRMAMELQTRLFSLDNDTNDSAHGAKTIYSMLIYQDGLDVTMRTMTEEKWGIIEKAYIDNKSPSESTYPEMIGIPYSPNEVLRHKAALLWNTSLTRIHERVIQEKKGPQNPWSPDATVDGIMNTFMFPMVSKKTGGFSSFSIDMTSKQSKRSRRSRRSKRSKSMKRALGVTRGGAQGAPLEHAFSGVVLPSDMYRPILKPMHGQQGGDGVVYQANLAPAPAPAPAPAVYAPTKGRKRRRSVKRKGKARGPGHALPPGFGQMVQSFRPL